MEELPARYPVNLEVDYPERLDRFTTFFRLIVAIPIVVILGFLMAGNARTGYGFPWYVFFPTVLMLLFRHKYPRWWFDWNVALISFAARVSAYLTLLRDEYPSTDEAQAVHLQIPYPDVQRELSRGLPLVKWLLAVPHYVVLVFLGVAALVVIIIAWFAILITTRYPRGLFDFVVGVLRWKLRVYAYAFLLTTDRYPPFRLSP